MLGFKLFGSGLSDLAVSAIGNDVNAAVSAAGTDQAGATELTNCLNSVTTVAASSGVRLYAGSAGDWQLVYNAGANPLRVYPFTGAKVNQLAANSPHVLAINTGCVYFTLSSTQIVGVLSA